MHAHWGWNAHFDQALADWDPSVAKDRAARVIRQERGYLRLWTMHGEFWGSVPGKFRQQKILMPGIGDWVVVDWNSRADDRVVIQHVLPPFSWINRKAAGERPDAQRVASNVDLAFIVTSANQEFSLERLERYISICVAGQVAPVVVISKVDLDSSWSDLAKLIRINCPAIRGVVGVSCAQDLGKQDLVSFAATGTTAVLIGSSGVGKSSIINWLIPPAEVLTAAVRSRDQRGRHTTTSRQIYQMDGGWLLIDTPGMREVGLVPSEEESLESFEDLEEASLSCKFTNCTHQKEPGCQIQAMVASSKLDTRRVEHWILLKNQRKQKKPY